MTGLFAAMNVATGEVLTHCQKGHTAKDVLRFFKQIDATVHTAAGDAAPPHPRRPGPPARGMLQDDATVLMLEWAGDSAAVLAD